MSIYPESSYAVILLIKIAAGLYSQRLFFKNYTKGRNGYICLRRKKTSLCDNIFFTVTYIAPGYQVARNSQQGFKMLVSQGGGRECKRK